MHATALPCTTVAGRHAAQLQRARQSADERDERSVALETLATALRSRPLRVVTDFHAANPETLPQLFCKCRVDYVGLDFVFIEATLSDQDWHPAAGTEQRRNGKYDLRVLEHGPTGTRLALIITLPWALFEHWEAA